MNTIIHFLGTIWNMATDEGRRLRGCLISVAIATLGGTLLLVVFSPSVGCSFVITFPIWLWTCYRVASVNRYIRVHILGEGLDVFQLTPAHGHVLDNDLARLYRRVMASILLLQTILFLGLPLYFNYTQGGRMLIVPMIMVAVAITLISWRFSVGAFSAFAGIVLVVFSVGMFLAMFPQVGYYVGLEKGLARLVPGSSAQKVNEIEKMRRKQIERLNNVALEEAKKWRGNNPGKPLPPEFQRVIEAVEKGVDYRTVKAVYTVEIVPGQDQEILFTPTQREVRIRKTGWASRETDCESLASNFGYFLKGSGNISADDNDVIVWTEKPERCTLRIKQR